MLRSWLRTPIRSTGYECNYEAWYELRHRYNGWLRLRKSTGRARYARRPRGRKPLSAAAGRRSCSSFVAFTPLTGLQRSQARLGARRAKRGHPAAQATLRGRQPAVGPRGCCRSGFRLLGLAPSGLLRSPREPGSTGRLADHLSPGWPRSTWRAGLCPPFCYRPVGGPASLSLRHAERLPRPWSSRWGAYSREAARRLSLAPIGRCPIGPYVSGNVGSCGYAKRTE